MGSGGFLRGFFTDENGYSSMNRLQGFFMVAGGVAIAFAATVWAVQTPGASEALLMAMYGQSSAMLLQGFVSKNAAKKIEKAGQGQ